MKTSEIASKLGGKLSGNPEIEISGVSSFGRVAQNQLTFLSSSDPTTDFSAIPDEACVLVPRDSVPPAGVTVIKVDDPKLAFALVTSELIESVRPEGIHKSLEKGAGAVVEARFVGSNVTVGRGTRVGAGSELHDGVSLGSDVFVGDRTILYPNTVVYDGCRIGDDCVLHAGVVLGADGFGYVRDGDNIFKFPQIGTVILENNVEIGANSCVDRGALGETRIGSHTKIDNLVQIAHNVSIGKRVLIAAQVGISGTVVIEDDVIIGGQVGIGDHVTIKSGAVIGGGSGIFSGKIVRSGFWAGKPVRPIKKYKEQLVLIHSLAQFRKELTELKEKMD